MSVRDSVRAVFDVSHRSYSLPIVSPRGTRLKLCELWRQLGYRQIVEIGTCEGEFAEQLLTRIPGCHLTCIDPWIPYAQWPRRTSAVQEQAYQATRQRLQPFGARVTVLRTTSQQALHLFADESLDAVFVDGDHAFDAAILDIVGWSQKVRAGGGIGVHDYMPMRRGGVVEAVNAYTHCHHIDPWYVTREPSPTAFWFK